MTFIEWQNTICEADRYLSLDGFLDRHRNHEIIVIEEAIHTWPTEPGELRQLCDGDAEVDYLGNESPHWADNDGLYYLIQPTIRKGRPEKSPNRFTSSFMPI